MTWKLSLLMAGALALVACGCAGQTGIGGNGLAAVPAAPAEPAGTKVVMYNIHKTFRCVCTVVGEKKARQDVEVAFAGDVATGRIEWRDAVYDDRPDMVERYGLTTSSIVVVALVDGKEVSHRTLDKVCDLYLKSDQFRAYVTEAVAAALADVAKHGESRAAPAS